MMEKNKVEKIWDVWLIIMIGIFFISLFIIESDGCYEDKITWLLLCLTPFIISYKFWREE